MSEEKEAKLQSVLNKTARYGFLPEWSHKTMDELLESSDITLFKAALKNPNHVIHPLPSPGYNLRKRSHDQDFCISYVIRLANSGFGHSRTPSPPSFPSPVPPSVSPGAPPLNQLVGLGERCKLPQWVWVPSRQTIWCISEPKGAALVATVFVHFDKNKFKFLERLQVPASQ